MPLDEAPPTAGLPDRFRIGADDLCGESVFGDGPEGLEVAEAGDALQLD